MKTKIIPFNLETAKKIQTGDIKGRIVQNNGLPATILAFDINGENLAVKFMHKDGTKGVSEYQPNGKVLAEWCSDSEEFALAIELPEEAPNINHEFKAGDCVQIKTLSFSTRHIQKYDQMTGFIKSYDNLYGKFWVSVPDYEVNRDVEILAYPSELKLIELKEIPKHEFKPFDKVLVRDAYCEVWRPDIFSSMVYGPLYSCLRSDWHYCIPFEGNEHLVGTTDKPKE